MVNLLKDNNNLKDVDFKEKDQKSNIQNVNIRRYKDPYGLTLGKMSFGLWLISNRRNFLSIFLAFLILASFIFWSLYLYTFGSYIFKGMKEDQASLKFLSRVLIPEDLLSNISASDLNFSKLKVFNVSNNKYDFLIKLNNPNKNYFAHFNYCFNNKGEDFACGSSFILPNESKYIMSLGVEIPQNNNIKTSKLVLKKLKWERIDHKNFPDWNIFKKNRLNVIGKKIDFLRGESSNLSDKINLNKLILELKNNSAYNYWQVNFNIVLLDRGEEVAANKYIVNNFMSGEKVNGSIVWPGNISRFDEVLIMPEIDITKDDIYIPIEGESGQLK